MNFNEKKILAITCFGHFMCHFNMLVFPALVIPLMKTLSLDMAEVLGLSFWMYLLFGITALPWGIITDRIGARQILMLFFVGSGISAILASFFISNPALFSLMLAGIGLFSGIYHPAGLGLISKGITRMSIALGYNGMAGNAGLASAPIITGIINYIWDERTAYLFVGILNLLGAVIMLMLLHEEPSKKISKIEKGVRSSYILGFLMLCFSMMLAGIAYRGSTVILPSYFELKNQELFRFLSSLNIIPNSPHLSATLFTSLVFLIGIMGQYMGGRFAERHDPKKAYLFFHLIPIFMAIGMAYTMDIWLILFSMTYLFFLLGMQPIENTLVALLTPDSLRHSAYGTKFILTFGVGALSVHMVGWIKESYSISHVFVGMAGVSFLIVISILLLLIVTRSIELRS